MKTVNDVKQWEQARAQIKSGESVTAKWSKPIGQVTGTVIKDVDHLKKYLDSIDAKDADIDDSIFAKFGVLRPVVISQEERDRDSDIVRVDGMRIDEYQKNPVLLFGHDQGTPAIGNGLMTSKDGGIVRSIAAFASKEINPFAGMIGDLYAHDIMRAVSIGFIGQGNVMKNAEGEYDGIEWTETELVEYSAVNVPSNRNALTQARSIGIDMSPMLAEIEKQLDESGMIAVKRADLEAAWKILGKSKTFSLPTFFDLVAETAKSHRSLKRKASADKIKKSLEGQIIDDTKVIHWHRVASLLSKAAPEIVSDAIEASTFDVTEEKEIDEATQQALQEITEIVSSLLEDEKEKPDEDKPDEEESGDDKNKNDETDGSKEVRQETQDGANLSDSESAPQDSTPKTLDVTAIAAKAFEGAIKKLSTTQEKQ